MIRASGRCGLLGIALAVMLALTAPMSAIANDTAKAVIEGFYQRLLEVMSKGPELGFEGRRAVLAPVLDETFDLPFLAKLVLGRVRKDLSPEQIDEFTRVFSAMVVATYASRFDNYEQERFAATGERGLKRGRVLVETQVEGTSMGTVRINYIMHQRDGAWRIINVISQGVSDISLKRAEYQSVIRKHGFDGLLNRIETRTAKMVREG